MSAEIFRDRTEGVIARRLDLLRKRRDELITMPHAVRRVFVARSARIAAATVACVGGAAMIVTAAVPGVYGALAGVLPGSNPAALSQLLLGTWILAIVVYAMARSRSEHRFIVALSKCVLPGDDVDHDIERLSHEHPDEIAKAMAQKLEVRSAAWPVMAAALLLPATVLYVIDSVKDHGWSHQYEYHLEGLSLWLAGSAAVGVVMGIVMTRRWARVALASTIAIAVATVAAIAVPIAVMQLGALPLWILTPLLLATTVAVVVQRLKRERALIDAIDPAAGSELFSWKKSLANVRRACAQISPRAAVGVAAFAGLVIVAGGAVSLGTPVSPTAAAVEVQPSANATAPVVTPVLAEAKPIAGARREVLVDVDIHGGVATEITGVAGFDRLPDGWKLTAIVRLVEPPPGGDVRVRATGFGSAEHRTDANGTVSKIVFSTCGAASPIGFRVEPEGTWSHRVQLAIAPTLEYAPCD